MTYTFSSALEDSLPTPNISCFDDTTLQVAGFAAEPGMAYEFLFRLAAVGKEAHIICTHTSNNASLTVIGAAEAWITWVGDTEYDMSAGDAAHSFTFKQGLPHDRLVSLLNKASPSTSTYSSLLAAHVSSYKTLIGPFSLSLNQQPDLTSTTDELKNSYRTDAGNTYFEWLLFNFGRYLLASSAPGILPANLQGKWADGSSNSWGAGERFYQQFCFYK